MEWEITYKPEQYVEYDKETVFIKDTCLSHIVLPIEEMFPETKEENE